jgi:RNA polymerase sigma-70 factor (ECF subfamily)
LLEQVRSGDERAFERLFARHRPYIRRVVALRLDQELRRRVDPSDVIQETQLEASRRLDDYLSRRPMPFRLWLRRTAEKRLSMLRRRHGAARRSLEREVQLPNRSSLALAQQLMASGLSPSEQFDQHELARLVRVAVAKLPDADRDIIIMRMYERLTNEEIACVLGIEHAAMRQRYGRALLRLRKILVESGLTDH